MDIKQVEANFSKCSTPLQFAQRYHYFRQKYKIDSLEKVLELLRAIEMIDTLGAFLIIHQQEPQYATEYARDYVKRNKDLLASKIQINNEHIVYYMQVVYICLMNLEGEEFEALADYIFSGDVYRPMGDDGFEFENAKFVTEHYARVFFSAVTKLPQEVNWEKDYCRIVTGIYKARKCDPYFLHYIEVGCRKRQLGDRVPQESARKYFDLLCSVEDYECAKYFLDNFDGKQPILGMEPRELLEKIYSLPSPELFAFGKWYAGLLDEHYYSYENWNEDIHRYNKDEDCLKWADLTLYLHKLDECCVTQKWQGFDKLLATAGEYELFHIGKIRYMKQIVEAMASITGKLIYQGKDVVGFLKAIEHININEFARTKQLYQWNMLGSVQGSYHGRDNYMLIRMFEKHSVEDVVYIYMNSHLKYVIPLEELIRTCSKHVGGSLYKLFENYPIRGRINNGSKLSSIRDKLFISPEYVLTNVSHSAYVEICKQEGPTSREARAFMKKMFRNQVRWYVDYKDKAELMYEGDRCTFIVCEYKENEGIMVSDIEIDPEQFEERALWRKEKYPKLLLNWLAEICEQEKFVDWEMVNPGKVVCGMRHLEDMYIRAEVALQILRTAVKLKNVPDELYRFLFAIGNPPLEEANEFRYIETQKTLEFNFPPELFSKLRDEIIELGIEIMKDRNLPTDLKKDVYLNTVMRKFFDLKQVCGYIDNEVYSESADEALVIAIRFEGKKGDRYMFSTKGRNNTIYSLSPFIYEGEAPQIEMQIGRSYLVTLKKYDFENGHFILEKVALSNKQTAQWKHYMRRLRDVKKALASGELSQIKNDLKQYHIRITSDHHIRQLAHELNLIFQRQKYSVEDALKTIDLISDTNPFLNKEIEMDKFKESFEEQYMTAYEAFFENFKTQYHATTGFCDLFFTSYLKVFISKERFLEDMVSCGKNRDEIMQYCMYRKYI